MAELDLTQTALMSAEWRVPTAVRSSPSLTAGFSPSAESRPRLMSWSHGQSPKDKVLLNNPCAGVTGASGSPVAVILQELDIMST